MSNLAYTIQNSEIINSEKIDNRYVRRLTPDPSGGFTATIHEFPGCIAEGNTADEALQNLEKTAISWINSAKFNGYPVNPPIDYEGASGKIALRISRRLHQLAAERADLEGVSLNQFIGNALAHYLGQQDGMRRLAHEVQKNVCMNFYVQIAGPTFKVEPSTKTSALIPDLQLNVHKSTYDNTFITKNIPHWI